ncbi:MAG TPA: ATP-binding cassette domain-containing protein [Anaerolineaceae bacterium]|nr:ATP-binding cassette domain-containing protein [Anaerolineaceae bacterium]
MAQLTATSQRDPAQNYGQNVAGAGAGGVLLQARGLSIHTRAGESLLSEISFHIEPGELVILTAPSHLGKSTLIQSLAGLIKPTSGEITIDGVSLYENLKAFRSSIGFVPAEFALHQHHTVAEILEDAALMRLPRRASTNDRKQRVQALLETVKLVQVADRRVGQLSKVDQRKLSIAVELAGYPGLLLLDESAGGLTPFEELQITTLLHELTKQGLTVIEVNQLSRCVGLSDKVIFLAPGGFLAWFGPAGEAFAFLQSFKSADSAVDSFGLEDAHEMLASPQSGDGTEWAKRFKAHPAYQKYVDDPLHDRYPNLLLQSQPLIRLRSIAKEKQPPAIVPRANSAQKLMLLIRRNTRLWWRGKTLLLMLAIPLIVALFDFVLSSPTMLNPQLGDPTRPPVVFGLLVFLDLLASALLFQNEIFKERAVYRRECRTTFLSFSYVLSKVCLVGIVGIYQGLVWTLVHFAATGMSGGIQGLLANGLTFTLAAFIGGILGLVASALSGTAIMIPAWVLILTVPQLFLSGAIIPLAQLNFPFSLLSGINPSRYAFETLLTTSGYGLDVASDPCWQLPSGQRNGLTDGQKQGCACMGDNIFSICKFPGIRAFYSYVIEQPRPVPPEANSAINNFPVQPLPKPGETLDQLAAEMNSYAAQIESYLGNYDAYLSTLRQYPETLANWQRMRSQIIGNAEGVIAEAIDHYGQGFDVNLTGHWSILAAMSLVLVVLLIGIQNGKSYATI